MSNSGDPYLNQTQRAAIHKIGDVTVRGNAATIEHISPNVNLRALAGRGLVQVTITLTERGRRVAAQEAVARKTKKPVMRVGGGL